MASTDHAPSSTQAGQDADYFRNSFLLRFSAFCTLLTASCIKYPPATGLPTAGGSVYSTHVAHAVTFTTHNPIPSPPPPFLVHTV
jgi:hypothetical protein